MEDITKFVYCGVTNFVEIITNDIRHIDKNITVIKKQTDEKVNSVDDIPDSELELFFTNKYEQPISNTGK